MVVLLTTAARPFIARSTTAPGLPASTSTATISFAAPTITPGLATANTPTTAAMPTTTISAAGSEHLTPAPGISERKQPPPALRASKRAHHAHRTEHRRDGSQFNRFADRVQFSQVQQRHQTANLQRGVQDQDHGEALASQHRPFVSRYTRGARELPLRGQLPPPLHQVQGDILHLNEGQSPADSGPICARLRHASQTSPPTRASRWRQRVCRLLPQLLQDHGDHTAFQLAQHFRAQRLRERDERMIINVTRCMLNGAAPPKSFLGKMAAIVVILLNRPPRKTIGGATSYYGMFGKHVDLSFLRRDTYTWGPSSASCAKVAAHPISSSPTVETATLSLLASATLHTAPATRRRGSQHQGACIFSLEGHPPQRQHLLRLQGGFPRSGAGQLQQSKQTPHEKVLRAARLDHG